MHLSYFSQQPMSAYPQEEAEKLQCATLMFPNRFFDPVEGARLYEERLQEFVYAEEVGFDGVLINEHHNQPSCMSARATVTASALAVLTKRVDLIVLGYALPLYDNPIALAEEIAMIDMISKGRLVSGMVRGAGIEHLALTVNPVHNRERFEEAHDLLIKIFTESGPFRWEGKHYHHRVVNPWVLPLQKPHPRIWVPGSVSKDTVEFAASHRYPYICLGTSVEKTKQIRAMYEGFAAEAGYQAGPEHIGYNLEVHVAETEEKALENARQFTWMQAPFTGRGKPEWSSPPGYVTPEARRARLQFTGYKGGSTSFEQQVANGTILAGTPKQVVPKLRVLLEESRPGIVVFWCNDGRVKHEDAMTCLRLMGQEVLPAVREIGKELGLEGPAKPQLREPLRPAETPNQASSPALAPA